MTVSIWQNYRNTIICERSTDIKLENSKRCPDSAFAYRCSKYPRVVIEVSYSQKLKNLSYLADAYIVESDEKIGVVISFDIDYKGEKKAKLSMWRPSDVLQGEEVCLESQCTLSEVSESLRYILGLKKLTGKKDISQWRRS
jgi:hypothetical protein